MNNNMIQPDQKTFANCCFGTKEELSGFAEANRDLFPPEFVIKKVLRTGDDPFFAAFTDDERWVLENKKYDWQWSELVDGKIRSFVTTFGGNGRQAGPSIPGSLMEVVSI